LTVAACPQSVGSLTIAAVRLIIRLWMKGLWYGRTLITSAETVFQLLNRRRYQLWKIILVRVVDQRGTLLRSPGIVDRRYNKGMGKDIRITNGEESTHMQLKVTFEEETTTSMECRENLKRKKTGRGGGGSSQSLQKYRAQE